MMSIIKKMCLGLLLVAVLIGGFKLLEYGWDGEMLYECYQMQEWQDQGHPNRIPDYCYDLGLPRK